MVSKQVAGQRLLLMGCGAVGGVIAGGLLQAGHHVTLITHNDEIALAINSGGLRVTTPEGQLDVPATAHARLEQVEGPFDAALLAMKATAVEDAARAGAGRLRGDPAERRGRGACEPYPGTGARDRRVGRLGGGTMHAPGVYERTSDGELVVGELDGRLTPRVQELGATLDAVTPATVSDNIFGVLWSKLAINCVVTTLGAVTGQLLGEILQRAIARRLALSIVSEVVDVAKAQSINLESVGGTLDLQRLYLPPERRAGDFGLDLIPRHGLILVVGLKFCKFNSSMLQSLERGRRPEIDFMNGYVVHKGRENGVPTPVNEALIALVQEIEAGTRPFTPQNLDGLLTG